MSSKCGGICQAMLVKYTFIIVTLLVAYLSTVITKYCMLLDLFVLYCRVCYNVATCSSHVIFTSAKYATYVCEEISEDAILKLLIMTISWTLSLGTYETKWTRGHFQSSIFSWFSPFVVEFGTLSGLPEDSSQLQCNVHTMSCLKKIV